MLLRCLMRGFMMVVLTVVVSTPVRADYAEQLDAAVLASGRIAEFIDKVKAWQLETENPLLESQWMTPARNWAAGLNQQFIQIRDEQPPSEASRSLFEELKQELLSSDPIPGIPDLFDVPDTPYAITKYLSFATDDEDFIRAMTLLDGSLAGEVQGTGSHVGGEFGKVDGNHSIVVWGQFNRVKGDYAAIVGGLRNTAHEAAFVGGGRFNKATFFGTTVGGGESNSARDSLAVVVGGESNSSAHAAFVGGGKGNKSRGRFSVVAGGRSNSAGGNLSTVAGGMKNEVSEKGGTIAGGMDNRIGGGGISAVIGGGSDHSARGKYSTVAGGYDNSIKIGATGASIAGGRENEARGVDSFIAGGRNNLALGEGSLAAGVQSRAQHDGAFVWSDARTDTDEFRSTSDHQFLIRADGGVGIGTNDPRAMLDVEGSIVGQSIAVDGEIHGSTLTLVGGSDLCERFQTDGPALPPGAVAVLDPSRPGYVEMSDEAYDRGVVGVVSGARGVRAGITLSQDGVLDGATSVAMYGRVWVLADATEQPIRPGDLLTSGSIAGHAIAVGDLERSHGAIIGKALSELREGTGHVLVLLALR